MHFVAWRPNQHQLSKVRIVCFSSEIHVDSCFGSICFLQFDRFGLFLVFGHSEVEVISSSRSLGFGKWRNFEFALQSSCHLLDNLSKHTNTWCVKLTKSVRYEITWSRNMHPTPHWILFQRDGRLDESVVGPCQTKRGETGSEKSNQRKARYQHLMVMTHPPNQPTNTPSLMDIGHACF